SCAGDQSSKHGRSGHHLKARVWFVEARWCNQAWAPSILPRRWSASPQNVFDQRRRHLQGWSKRARQLLLGEAEGFDLLRQARVASGFSSNVRPLIGRKIAIYEA